MKHGTRAETKEGFKVQTFARIFGLSQQAVINDDLGAFADASVAWGRAAAETEAGLLLDLFNASTGNGVTLDDGQPIYTTGRKNKAASGTVIDIVNLGAARQAMRETKGLDGVTPIGVTPPPSCRRTRERNASRTSAGLDRGGSSVQRQSVLGQTDTACGVAVCRQCLALVRRPRRVATIVIAYLNGQNGPILDTREGWSTLGVEFRAILDFGCGIADWRGTYLNGA